MVLDRQSKRLWIADETGEVEELRPGPGFNGRTREPGTPDWWVEAKDKDWRPASRSLAAAPGGGGRTKPNSHGQEQPYDERGRYAGKGGGGRSTQPAATPGAGRTLVKLAGADSEAGRKPAQEADEPRSLLSATAEQLEAIGKGIGEAVEKGAEGAGTALSRTREELTTNEDLHEGLEFGGKAAWEVSKDVFEKAGGDALGAYVGYRLKNTDKDPSVVDALGPAGGLIMKGVRLYDQAPDWGRSLGKRINKIKDDAYSKE